MIVALILFFFCILTPHPTSAAPNGLHRLAKRNPVGDGLVVTIVVLVLIIIAVCFMTMCNLQIAPCGCCSDCGCCDSEDDVPKGEPEVELKPASQPYTDTVTRRDLETSGPRAHYQISHPLGAGMDRRLPAQLESEIDTADNAEEGSGKYLSKDVTAGPEALDNDGRRKDIAGSAGRDQTN
ncbi:hypothetical protein AURDEDRAFT_149670 [Auricularia subglabra TFB-10046 SS5]|nr:hypothetical protein AURDEDRAFT_149670 [Auricularia subglabra TFB-10046 SS5]